ALAGRGRFLPRRASRAVTASSGPAARLCTASRPMFVLSIEHSRLIYQWLSLDLRPMRCIHIAREIDHEARAHVSTDGDRALIPLENSFARENTLAHLRGNVLAVRVDELDEARGRPDRRCRDDSGGLAS